MQLYTVIFQKLFGKATLYSLVAIALDAGEPIGMQMIFSKPLTTLTTVLLLGTLFNHFLAINKRALLCQLTKLFIPKTQWKDVMLKQHDNVLVKGYAGRVRACCIWYKGTSEDTTVLITDKLSTHY